MKPSMKKFIRNAHRRTNRTYTTARTIEKHVKSHIISQFVCRLCGGDHKVFRRECLQELHILSDLNALQVRYLFQLLKRWPLHREVLICWTVVVNNVDGNITQHFTIYLLQNANQTMKTTTTPFIGGTSPESHKQSGPSLPLLIKKTQRGHRRPTVNSYWSFINPAGLALDCRSPY